MPLAGVQRGGLVSQAVSQLRELIARGEWPLGSRIPAEADLATALGVGRNTIREAVHALAYTGVLEVRQGDGTYVRATSDLAGLVRREVAGVDQRHIIEVRRGLEVEGSRLAASRRTGADLRSMKRALAERKRAWTVEDTSAWVDADAAFHAQVIAAAHNPLLVRLYTDFAGIWRASIAATVRARLAEKNTVDHDQLLTAIETGDEAAAASRARAVLDEAWASRPEPAKRSRGTR